MLTGKGDCYKRLPQAQVSQRLQRFSLGRLLQDLPAGLVERLNYFRELSPILLPDDEVAAVQDLIILLHQALTTYEELCASRRSLDFTALEQLALRVLTDDNLPELFNRLDRRLTHLLVDEFQDTSVNQMHLLCRLLAGWQGDRRRSLMVVGDPKQSIYGWRQARLELFFQSRDAKGLPRCPEAPTFTTLTLKTNFRSTQTLIEWVMRFSARPSWPIGKRAGWNLRRRWPSLGPRPVARRSWHCLLVRTGTAREREADWLAERIKPAPDKHHPRRNSGRPVCSPGRICAMYLEAFRRAGLSLRVQDGCRWTTAWPCSICTTWPRLWSGPMTTWPGRRCCGAWPGRNLWVCWLRLPRYPETSGPKKSDGMPPLRVVCRRWRGCIRSLDRGREEGRAGAPGGNAAGLTWSG